MFKNKLAWIGIRVDVKVRYEREERGEKLGEKGEPQQKITNDTLTKGEEREKEMEYSQRRAIASAKSGERRMREERGESSSSSSSPLPTLSPLPSIVDIKRQRGIVAQVISSLFHFALQYCQSHINYASTPPPPLPSPPSLSPLPCPPSPFYSVLLWH